ncbi:TetR/AcrR family transcriptional regulator [Aliirhizobium cellulosilyticum]|uniref:AcrR family transcriptional regulator n=1 Tax=Aliirhizobium cellulosilyticum TaxID=393664 RepID=A0A7W6XAG4_9HYPH|nr:TetR/AcrR family transcriptional regulator [Rhizobium cellulosilyticum]MBB4346597.1 AcrR family transcriptional regulator [Rhizobium cellulosilyticum]MBB4411009.1 AcrR family transcriptional regulator [Rhizobium cellulosilyticum]MBB4445698.1 AcrR family transcriptional regulator [Rhizobium cellulosilyticum]
MPRSNRERTDATRTALLDAARTLFVEKGYAETATPDIVAAAEVTRGALYHHFADKKALFWAVIEREAKDVAADIDARSADASSAREALLQGASAYFDAMAVPGRTKLLLKEAPAQHAIDSGEGEDPAEEGLKIGLSHLLSGSENLKLLDPLTSLISSAFEKAAIAINCGANRTDYEAAIAALLDGLTVQPRR